MNLLQGRNVIFAPSVGVKYNGTKHLILRLGSLDDDPQSIEKNHIWVSQKASWYSINNKLAEFPGFE